MNLRSASTASIARRLLFPLFISPAAPSADNKEFPPKQHYIRRHRFGSSKSSQFTLTHSITLKRQRRVRPTNSQHYTAKLRSITLSMQHSQ